MQKLPRQCRLRFILKWSSSNDKILQEGDLQLSVVKLCNTRDARRSSRPASYLSFLGEEGQ
jgi:hypothetical protein